MQNKQPPFEINEQIMAEVIEIAELVGKVSVRSEVSSNPNLAVQIGYAQYTPPLQ